MPVEVHTATVNPLGAFDAARACPTQGAMAIKIKAATSVALVLRIERKDGRIRVMPLF